MTASTIHAKSEKFIIHPEFPSIAFCVNDGLIYGLYLADEVWPTAPYKDHNGIGWMDKDNTIPVCVAPAKTRVNNIDEFNQLTVNEIEF